MDKNKKFAFIWLFTTAVKMEKTFDQRVLVATTAAHIGTKQPLFNYVLRVGLPRCIITLLQERGRNSRNSEI